MISHHHKTIFIQKYRIPTYAGYRDYYDAETRAFVEELYATDIEMFGYEFADSPA